MKPWFQRIAAILFLAVGLACAFVPFPDYLTEQVCVETIGVDVAGFAEGGEPLSGVWRVETGGDGAKYAGILKSLGEIIDGDRAGGGMHLVRTTAGKAAAFLPPDTDGDSSGDSRFSFVFRDRVFRASNHTGWLARIVEGSATPMTPSLETTINVESLGRVLSADGAVMLTDEVMVDRSRLRAFLEGDRDVWDMSKEDFPTWPEWEELVVEAGGVIGADKKTRVIYGGRVLDVGPDTRTVSVRKVVPGLKTAVKVTGAVLCVAGVLLLAALYRRPNEAGAIRTGSPGYQLAGDVIVIVLAAVAAVSVVDHLLGRWFGVDLLVNDDFAYSMSAFFLAVAVPLVSLYQTSAGAQYLWVTEEGVRLKSLFSDKRLSWAEIEGVRCKPVRMTTVRAGVPLSRTLSRNLVIEGGGKRLSIIEPSRARKRRIVQDLREHAPEKWRGPIEEVGKEWEPYASW